MNGKMKKIIAREGLILLGVIFLATIIYFTGTHTAIRWEQYRVDPEPYDVFVLWARGSLAFIVGIFVYLFYWIARFIIWAIQTLNINHRGKQMLYCGRSKNVIVEAALHYLPTDIYDKIEGEIAITVLGSDACRLAKEICNHEEIIILSPWIFSFMPPSSCEIDKEWRYFIFSILHEVAHAVCKHLPPNELSPQKRQEQELDADKYALKWFNDYAQENSKRGLTPLAIEEIKEQQEKYQKKLEPICS